jgi:mannan endo-1,6-alpha-mannosidase
LRNDSFKAFLSRSLAASMALAPFLQPLVMPYIQASAQAAAQQCSGGTDGVTCGMKWAADGPVWDGSYGVGQQMAALEILIANLGRNSSAPVTSSTGGTSQGNPLAGTGSDNAKKGVETLRDITVGDRAGAGILTGVLCLFTMGSGW